MLGTDCSSIISGNMSVNSWSRNRSFMLRMSRNREKQKKKEIERQKKLEEQQDFTSPTLKEVLKCKKKQKDFNCKIKEQDLNSQQNTQLNETIENKQIHSSLPSPNSKLSDDPQEDNLSTVEIDAFFFEQLYPSSGSEGAPDFPPKPLPSGTESYFEDPITEFDFPQKYPTDQTLEDDIPNPSGFIASSCHSPPSSSSNNPFSSSTSLSGKNKKSFTTTECQVDLVNFIVVNDVLYITPGPDAGIESSLQHIKSSYPESNPEPMDFVLPQSINFLNVDQISGWKIFKSLFHGVLPPYKWLLSKPLTLCLLCLLPHCRFNLKSLFKDKIIVS